MSPGVFLLFVLVAVFALTGALHLMVWVRRTATREHLWFGLGSLAAAGTIAAYCARPYLQEPALGAAQQFSAFFCIAWFIAMAWFAVEYASCNHGERRLASVLTLMFLTVLVGNLLAPGLLDSLAFLEGHGPLDVLIDIAFLGLCALVWLATARLWRANERVRAVIVGAGMGVALAQIALYASMLELKLVTLPTPVPHAFLVMVLLMAYELARSAEAARALSERQLQGLVHTSRLAIVGELTASIAHEINQPLGAILSNAEAGDILLGRVDPPLEEIRQILQDIHRDGLRASNVIRQVRTLVRKQQFTLEKLDANTLAEDVMDLVAGEARKRRIRLHHAPALAPAYIRGDRAPLEQVLLNLLLNAMDAMDTMGSTDADDEPEIGSQMPVVLGVTQLASDDIEIRIVDGGPGIPPDRLDRLFDSFYTSKAHGMGLGLSIARSIVEAHGGWIHAENNPSAGATFRVIFPPFQRSDR